MARKVIQIKGKWVYETPRNPKMLRKWKVGGRRGGTSESGYMSRRPASKSDVYWDHHRAILALQKKFSDIKFSAQSSIYWALQKAQAKIMEMIDEQKNIPMLTGSTVTSILSAVYQGKNSAPRIMGLPSVRGRRATHKKLSKGNGSKVYRFKHFATGEEVTVRDNASWLTPTNEKDAWGDAYMKLRALRPTDAKGEVVGGIVITTGVEYMEYLEAKHNIKILNHARRQASKIAHDEIKALIAKGIMKKR